MLGSHPEMIIMNQDLAMTKAIPQFNPNIFNRYCIWHILQRLLKVLMGIKNLCRV